MKFSSAPGATSIARIASLLGLLAFQGPALAGLGIARGDAPGTVRVTVTNPSDSACGAEVAFGDGKSDRRRLEPKEQWQIQHAFGSDGNFTVSLSGVPVIRGLRSVGPCALQQQVAVTVAGGEATAAAAPAAAPAAPGAAPGAAPAAQRPAPAQAQAAPAASPGESADLILFYRKSSNELRFVTAIDGTRKLDSVDRLVSNGYRLCYVLFPDTYRGLGGAEVQRVLDGEVGRVMNALAGNRQVRSSNTECIRGGQFVGASSTDVVAVQRRVVPDLSAVREFQGFEQFAEVKYDTLAQAVTRRQQAATQRTQDVAAWTAEIDTLAAATSTDKVGSVTLSLPEGEREAIRACTLEYSGMQGQAVIAYGNSLISYLSPAARTRASDLRATFNANQPYSSVYKTIDDFYVDLQKDSKKCNVFVDFPKNLKTLLTALTRDRRPGSFEVNNLVATPELREAWAKRQGFESLAASEFAGQVRTNAAGLKSLADKGIRDKAAFDRAVEEMRAAKYGDGSAVSDVLAYLDDKAAAAEKRGATAVSIRDERVRAQRAEAERRAQEEQRRRAEYAKEFPYTATISCGMNDRHINVMACMSGSGSLKTQLELNNGSQYKMYQPWEMNQAGRETSEGVVIPLRSDFKLKIQNVHDTLILSVKIVANANGRVVFNKSASRFGVILVDN